MWPKPCKAPAFHRQVSQLDFLMLLAAEHLEVTGVKNSTWEVRKGRVHVEKPRFSALDCLNCFTILQWSLSYKFDILVTHLCVSSYCTYYYDTIHGGTRASVDNVQAFLSTVFVDLDSSHCGVVLLHFGASDEKTIKNWHGRKRWGGFSCFCPFASSDMSSLSFGKA